MVAANFLLAVLRFFQVLIVSLLLAGLVVISPACANPQFPPLTDRIVDQAEIMSPADKQDLIVLLEQHEAKTSNQIVIVTLKSLQGYAIADYGYRLGRHWGIGQKDKNNGALLIIAPNERKIRIEVGYGLEGHLTDAMSSHIIHSEILPRFRSGDYVAGIHAGVNAMLGAVEGSYTVAPSDSANIDESIGMLIPVFFTLMIVASQFFRGKKSRRVVNSLIPSSFIGVMAWIITSVAVLGLVIAVLVFVLSYFNGLGNRSGIDHGGPWHGGGGFGGGGGGFGGGGFGGGGGGFGGGGASGGW